MNKKNTKKHSDDYYQQIVERNIDHMLDHPHVHSFGLGYRQLGDKFTDEVCLVIEIYKKKSRVAAKWKIPDFIDGIPTDIIELAEPDCHDNDDPEALLDLQAEHHEPVPMASIPCLPPPPEVVKPERQVQDATQPLPEFQIEYRNVVRQDYITQSVSQSAESENQIAAQEPFDFSPQLIVGFGRNSKEDQEIHKLDRIKNIDFDPLMGGIPIKNPLIDGINAVVLGAIVFDSTSGAAHGLSVHHGIGDGAQINHPIHQPLKSDAKYRIGKLVVSDPEFDTALFELDSERSYLGKIKGLEEDFEPGQPKTLRKDMVVECFGRRTYAKGVIKQVLHRKTPTGHRLSKARIHLYPGFRTKGGDSGAVWVEEKSQSPVGLHCGSLKKNAFVDVAHSVVDIAKRFNFQFHPLAKSRVLAAELDPFETCFVNQSDGFLAVCHRNGYDVKAKKFGSDFSKKSEKVVNANYQQVRGLAAVNQPGKSSPAGDTVIGFWLSSDWNQTTGCKIQMGSLNKGGTKMKFGKILNFRTHFSPAVAWFENKFVLAFTDGATGKLNIATSSNGKTWSRKTTTASAFSAPSITVFNGQLYLSWVAPSPYVPWPNNTRGQVKIGTLKPDGRSFTISSSKKVTGHNATAFSPSICASDENLFLAYTDSNNQIEIMKSARTSGWSQYKAIETKSAISPTLFFFEGELVCSRRTNVASWY